MLLLFCVCRRKVDIIEINLNIRRREVWQIEIERETLLIVCVFILRFGDMTLCGLPNQSHIDCNNIFRD